MGGLNVVTNFQSKRKTPTSFAFSYRTTGSEPHFGATSSNSYGRQPEELSISKSSSRQFRRFFDQPSLASWESQSPNKQEYFPYKLPANVSTDMAITRSMSAEATQYSPPEVELLASMLQYAQQVTQNFVGQSIKECVVTVPAWFTQHEKQALFTAATVSTGNHINHSIAYFNYDSTWLIQFTQFCDDLLDRRIEFVGIDRRKHRSCVVFWK